MYKRQVYVSATFTVRFILTKQTSKRSKKFSRKVLSSPAARTAHICRIPVSYTHLDVYKRQAQWRRQRITEKAKDYVVLDNIKGKGQYVGTYLALTSLERYW